MKTCQFARAIAVMLVALSIPRMVMAQQACIDNSACGPSQACVGSACHDRIYCLEDKDCGGGLGTCNVAQHRCKCANPADCGTSGTCGSEGVCKMLDPVDECVRACLRDSECGAGHSCTFETTYIDELGLCCPRVTGTPEEPFSCHTGSSESHGSNELILAGLLAACAITGRIRTRAAGRAAHSDGKNSKPRA
jgi:hypothetical protein